MITPELEQYVRESLAAGVSVDEVKANLRAQGWPEEDISAAFGAPVSTIPLPPAPPPPSQMPANMPVQQPTASYPPIAAPYISPTATAQPASASLPQNGTQRSSGGISGAKFATLAIVAGLILLIGGGAAFAYMEFLPNLFGPSAKEVFDKMPSAMRGLTGVQLDSAVSISGTLSPSGQLAASGMTKSDFSLKVSSKGMVTGFNTPESERKFDGDISVAGTYKMGSVQFNVDMSAEMKIVGEDYYVKFNTFPVIPFAPDYSSKITGKWIKISKKDLESGAFTIDTNELKKASDDAELEAKEIAGDLRQAYEKSPVFSVASSEKTSDGGPAQFHYVLAFDEGNLRNFLSAASDIFARRTKTHRDRYERMGFSSGDLSGISELTSGNVDIAASWIAPILRQLATELWIERDSSYLTHAKVHLPYATSTEYGALALDAMYDIILSKFNESFSVEVPSATVTVEDIAQALAEDKSSALGIANTKTRDARRVSDVKSIQLALELYYDGHYDSKTKTGSYPLNLSALVPLYLQEVPRDPSDGIGPVYQALRSDGKNSCSSEPCPKYFLGVSLEDPQNIVLIKDADSDPSGPLNGSDVIGCSGEQGRSCYDITQ
jgi:hypothetical protein